MPVLKEAQRVRNPISGVLGATAARRHRESFDVIFGTTYQPWGLYVAYMLPTSSLATESTLQDLKPLGSTKQQCY